MSVRMDVAPSLYLHFLFFSLPLSFLSVLPTGMIEFFIQKCQPRDRIKFLNKETYTFLWPYLFSAEVPAARTLCRWAARRGAAVHGGLRLRLSKTGCSMTAVRDIRAGRPLLSIPSRLVLSTDNDGEHTRKTVQGRLDSYQELSLLLLQHLHTRRSPYGAYVEFLYDLHNAEREEGEGLFAAAGASAALAARLEHMYGGNAMEAHGVTNAPFLSKKTLTCPESRVEWIRLNDLVRQLEQGSPHFVSKSAAWALSMALARSVGDDQGGLSLFPLIDLCEHSFTPNAFVKICLTPDQNKAVGLKWHDGEEPCVHLIAARDIRSGESITRLYSPRRVESQLDAEHWQLQFGFVPK
ncbi:hypothetical protein AGDE_05519 [Angomonas deanei]|uniref:SET domain containing protein, putative n=1 Tax=Angomonas deanei TaxID=59799 RepID=A0A7G2C7Z4_9TRYP|nr:hypothetical protein AGDE_05519 [Angomonas deanei]CAD2214853.1 SET domain containing protein, putative [Angomonas deanei]|eukprot:EPY38410.1 hypothetical protein AGDE_05519 [Angomonas deanei]